MTASRDRWKSGTCVHLNRKKWRYWYQQRRRVIDYKHIITPLEPFFFHHFAAIEFEFLLYITNIWRIISREKFIFYSYLYGRPDKTLIYAIARERPWFSILHHAFPFKKANFLTTAKMTITFWVGPGDTRETRIFPSKTYKKTQSKPPRGFEL